MCDQHTDKLCPFKFSRTPAEGVASMDTHIEEDLWHCEPACQLYTGDGGCALAGLAQTLGAPSHHHHH